METINKSTVEETNKFSTTTNELTNSWDATVQDDDDDNVAWCSKCDIDFVFSFSDIAIKRDGIYVKCPNCGEIVKVCSRIF